MKNGLNTDSPETTASSQKEALFVEQTEQPYHDLEKSERSNYWQVYAQKIVAYSERYWMSPVVEITDCRKIEPKIDLYVDWMVSAVARLYCLPYEEMLAQHFLLDEESKKFARISSIPGINEDIYALAIKIGNLTYDSLESILRSFSASLKTQSESKHEISEVEESIFLSLASKHLSNASDHISKAWEICKRTIIQNMIQQKMP
jgi:hypothetical protein